jgi:3-hydroxymyristoyl/3-hydroxydecanoyl-(acyl carrier protein) dehydratase
MNAQHRATLPFTPDHPVFAGHFPGHPIIPGVQLIDGAQRLIERQCGQLLAGLQAAKFLSPVAPGEALELAWRFDEQQVVFEIHCGERKIASGQFLLAAGESAGGTAD